MKKILLIILSLFTILPSIIFAEDIIYDKFDLKVPYIEGTKVKDITYKIYVSTIEDGENLKERTSDFKVENFKYYKINELEEKEYLDKTYELIKDEEYGFEMTISSNINAIFDNIYSNQIMINGVDFDDTKYSFENVDSKIILDVLLNEKEEVIEEEKPEITIVTTEKEIEKEKENDCLLGLEICCQKYYGISVCLWAVMGLAFLLIVITAIRTIIDKHDDKKYKEF